MTTTTMADDTTIGELTRRLDRQQKDLYGQGKTIEGLQRDLHGAQTRIRDMSRDLDETKRNAESAKRKAEEVAKTLETKAADDAADARSRGRMVNIAQFALGILGTVLLGWKLGWLEFLGGVRALIAGGGK